MARKRQPAIQENQLKRWRLLEEFNRHLAQAMKGTPLHPSWQSPQRQLQIADYLGLFLLGIFNPVVNTMRGLCQASHLARVQAEFGGRPVSLGSFSESQALVDPAFLKKMYDVLHEKVVQQRKAPAGSPHRHVQDMQIVDSTLWYALPRMHWAIWRKQHGNERAFRLHARFQVADDMPSDFTLTEGRRCERREWESMAQAGDFYVGDRYYGEDYSLLTRLNEKGCFYGVRLRTDAQWVVEEELDVDEAAREVGVVWHAWVRLGKAGRGSRVRIVQISIDEEQLFVATNLTVQEMSAELVSHCYRGRWQVELFFRWLKHIMKADHWMAESQNGVSIQIYLTLIAAQLLLLFTGRRPNRRTMELLQFMEMGWASPEEVVALLEKAAAPRKKRSS